MILKFINKNFVLALQTCAILFLAGCAGTLYGSGATSRNETIIGVAVTDGKTDESFELRSNTGWVCKGQLTEKQARQWAGQVTVPLTCSDGRSGTSLLTSQVAQGQLNLQFKLSDGLTGTVIFNAVQ